MEVDTLGIKVNGLWSLQSRNMATYSAQQFKGSKGMLFMQLNWGSVFENETLKQNSFFEHLEWLTLLITLLCQLEE